MVSHVVSQSNEMSLPTALNDANTNESRTIKVTQLLILTRIALGYVQLCLEGRRPLNEEDLGRCFQPKPQPKSLAMNIPAGRMIQLEKRMGKKAANIRKYFLNFGTASVNYFWIR